MLPTNNRKQVLHTLHHVYHEYIKYWFQSCSYKTTHQQFALHFEVFKQADREDTRKVFCFLDHQYNVHFPFLGVLRGYTLSTCLMLTFLFAAIAITIQTWALVSLSKNLFAFSMSMKCLFQ